MSINIVAQYVYTVARHINAEKAGSILVKSRTGEGSWVRGNYK